jgi:hypothetical protein
MNGRGVKPTVLRETNICHEWEVRRSFAPTMPCIRGFFSTLQKFKALETLMNDLLVMSGRFPEYIPYSPVFAPWAISPSPQARILPT